MRKKAVPENQLPSAPPSKKILPEAKSSYMTIEEQIKKFADLIIDIHIHQQKQNKKSDILSPTNKKASNYR